MMIGKRQMLLKCTFTFWVLVVMGIAGDSLFGQDLQHDYTPLRSYQAPKKLIQDIQAQYRAWGQETQIENKKVKAAFEDFIRQKSTFIYVMDSIQSLMYSDTISHFLNEVKNQIVENNKILQGQTYHIFTYRSLEPNAFSLGEGVILVSTGLLERLTTTDQVAFVMAHEMGHDLLQHVYKNGLYYCESLYADGFKRKIQKLHRKEAGRSTELKATLNQFKAQHMQYSRQNEFQADSIGFRLIAAAGYQKPEAINVLNILDQSDHLRFTDTLVLQDFFHFENYPFKTYWLDKENSMMSWEEDPSLTTIPDSLKSHPDCSIRIARLETQSANVPGIEKGNISTRQDLQTIAGIIPFEVVESLVNSHEYVLALYLALHMQKEYPQNLYLKCVADHCLYELGDAIRRNEFLEYVEFPDKDFSIGYNHLLVFLHNMNSSSLKNLFHHYLQAIEAPDDHVYSAFLQVLDQQPVTGKMASDFDSKYHDPYFTSLLKDKIQPNTTKK